MACNYQPRRSVGPSAWRCLQLLGGIVGFGGFGTALSAKDVAFASLTTALQVYMGSQGKMTSNGLKIRCESYLWRLTVAATQNLERATGIEPATSSLGIKSFAPLFSPLTKPLRKNQRACSAYRACNA